MRPAGTANTSHRTKNKYTTASQAVLASVNDRRRPRHDDMEYHNMSAPNPTRKPRNMPASTTHSTTPSNTAYPNVCAKRTTRRTRLRRAAPAKTTEPNPSTLLIPPPAPRATFFTRRRAPDRYRSSRSPASWPARARNSSPHELHARPSTIYHSMITSYAPTRYDPFNANISSMFTQ